MNYYDLNKIDFDKCYNIKYQKSGYGKRYRQRQKIKKRILKILGFIAVEGTIFIITYGILEKLGVIVW